MLGTQLCCEHDINGDKPVTVTVVWFVLDCFLFIIGVSGVTILCCYKKDNI